ncbi:MAG: ATP-dependent helicase [Actinomycetota bacterium]|nr:ATP-dependent helicase [Actinomycetota bacterium]
MTDRGEVTARDRPAWADGLNDQQRHAVDHDGGPLLVVAGAGTGKTKTLVARLARLIDEGVAPDRIALLTFSRRAADEMIRRTGALTDTVVARRVEAGTFHAVAHRLLRTYGVAVGLGEGWSVMDGGDAAELMGLVRADVRSTGNHDGSGRRRFPQAHTLASIYSRVVNAGVPLSIVVSDAFPWCGEDVATIATIFAAYTERKRAAALVDFDDLLLFWRAATTHPTLGPAMARLYDHVLVDEYQDTNGIQADILAGLCVPGGSRQHSGEPGEGRAGAGLTVVGDDSQAIYGFRSACVGNLLGFTDRFPGGATVVLEQNYRSTQPTLDLANAVLADMTAGHRKQLWTARRGGRRPILATCADEAAQVDAVCDVIIEHYEQGVALRDQVVLSRAAHHTDLLELELHRRHLPFVKFGGLRFVEAAHVRDLVSCLRVLDNPWDELAWSRVLGLLDGVGPTTVTRLLVDLGVRPRLIRPAGADPLSVFVGPDRPRVRTSADDLDALVSALVDCRRPGLAAGAQVDRLGVALDPLIRRRYDHAEVRLADFAALVSSTAAGSSRSALIADLALGPPSSTGDLAGAPHLDDDWLTLSTVHSAKGGEWRVVHVVHAADGMFPSDLATGHVDGIDEERRLFYVALTRAQDQLHLYAPLRYHHGGAMGRGDRHSWAQRTRFLPPAVDPLLDQRAVRSPPPGRSGDDHEVSGAVDEMLRALW